MEVTNQTQRWNKASKVKKLKQVDLPLLSVWNYEACEHHDSPRVNCEFRACGGHPFGYQTVAASYHYLAQKSAELSKPGTGKTLMILLTLSIARHFYDQGKSKDDPKAIIVVPTVAVDQWYNEISRWTPGFRVAKIKGQKPKDRANIYASYKDWDILLIGYHMFTTDVDMLENVPVNFFVSDDVDALHSRKNKTHKAIVRVATNCKYVIVANATPTQTHLDNLYSALVPIDANLVLGGPSEFERNYIQRSAVYVRVGKELKKTYPVTGYKNLPQLARLFKPMHIRYTYEQVADDVSMPELIAVDVPLDLYPKQRRAYELLQEGLFDLNGTTQQQRRLSALAKFVKGNLICAGMQAAGEEDGPKLSSKIDWVHEKILSDFSEDKVVVYAINKGTIKALQQRMEADGVGYATVDGSTKDKGAQQKKFWEDPDCRVMFLSAAGERSLNLQCAQVLIMLDSQYNPARVQQIAGRLRRAGSEHKTVRVFKLYTTDTQEERVSKVLAARQIVADRVNDEIDDSNLFERLDPDEILKLIKP